jgi:hypothetical protein
MKKMSLLFPVLALQLSATAFAGAGGVTSNGPVGRVLLSCQGSIHFSRDNMAEVYVSVAPVMGQGLVARVVFSPETRIATQFRKVEQKADARGNSFEGSKIDLLVPNMQAPNQQPGHFNAILNLSDFSPFASTLDCTRF